MTKRLKKKATVEPKQAKKKSVAPDTNDAIKKPRKTNYPRNIVDKEVLYQEFFTNRDKYATLSHLYLYYYFPILLQKNNSKVNVKKAIEEAKKVRIPANFNRLCTGFIKRRNKDIQDYINQEKKREADANIKRKRESDLKNDFLAPTPYLEQFKFMKDITDYALRRVTLKIANAINGINQLQQRISNGEHIADIDKEMPTVTLTTGEIDQMRMYRQLFETARTALKLPIKYNLNLEEDTTRESVGELFRILTDLEKQGGKIVNEKGKQIDLNMPAVFDRSKLKAKTSKASN